MDANDPHGGYPAMGPLVDSRVDVPGVQGAVAHGPDLLMLVEDPTDARVALEAAERTVLVDGRATAWTVAGRLVTGAFYVTLSAAVLGDVSFEETWTLVPTWLVLVVLPLVLVLQLSCARMVGLTPRASARWARWAGPVSWTALVAGFLAIGFDPWWFVGLLTAGVLVHGAVPVVGWRRAVRRGASSECRWPRGAEAFAILSILARADSVAPDRLSAIAGLEPAAGERWLRRLRSERSLSGGRRRHRIFGDQRVSLTAPGRERLERMRDDLERVAAQVPVG